MISRLGVALAIGLMVGLERGWRARTAEDNSRAAGLRTYGLSGLLGGVAGLLGETAGPQIGAAVFLAFAFAFTAFHGLEATRQGTVSVTAVVAGLLTFALGMLAAVGQEQAAIAAAVAMTVLLALRVPLHRWVASVTWDEIRAGLTLLVMTFLLLPLLPDRGVDPWSVVNPREVWLLTILIALISFSGYVAVRLFGDSLGILVTAAAGGLASSTATTLTLARLAKEQPASARLLSGGIAVSGAMMMLRVAGVAVVLKPALLAGLGAPLAVAALVMVVAGGGLILRQSAAGQATGLAVNNPLAVGTAVKLAAVIVLVMLAAEAVQRHFGEVGLLIVAAVSGVADVDAITLSVVRMPVAPVLAEQAILLAVAVNSASKVGLAAITGGAAVAWWTGAASLAAIVAGGLVWAL